jgi:hypothetical protein
MVDIRAKEVRPWTRLQVAWSFMQMLFESCDARLATRHKVLADILATLTYVRILLRRRGGREIQVAKYYGRLPSLRPLSDNPPQAHPSIALRFGSSLART